MNKKQVNEYIESIEDNCDLRDEIDTSNLHKIEIYRKHFFSGDTLKIYADLINKQIDLELNNKNFHSISFKGYNEHLNFSNFLAGVTDEEIGEIINDKFIEMSTLEEKNRLTEKYMLNLVNRAYLDTRDNGLRDYLLFEIDGEEKEPFDILDGFLKEWKIYSRGFERNTRNSLKDIKEEEDNAFLNAKIKTILS